MGIFQADKSEAEPNAPEIQGSPSCPRDTVEKHQITVAEGESINKDAWTAPPEIQGSLPRPRNMLTEHQITIAEVRGHDTDAQSAPPEVRGDVGENQDTGAVTPLRFDKKKRLITSWLFSPDILAAIRGLIAIYCFSTIIIHFVHDATKNHGRDIGRSFSYLSNLNWLGISFYFLHSAIQGAIYAATGSYPLQHAPNLVQATHKVLHTSMIMLPPLVTVVFSLWEFPINNAHFEGHYDAWRMISLHYVNSGLTLFELIFTSALRPRAKDVFHVVVILGLYLCLVYLTYATEGFYAVHILDPAVYSSGLMVGVCIMFLLGLAFNYCIVALIMSLRNAYQPSGKKSSVDIQAVSVDHEMV